MSTTHRDAIRKRLALSPVRDRRGKKGAREGELANNETNELSPLSNEIPAGYRYTRSLIFLSLEDTITFMKLASKRHDDRRNFHLRASRDIHLARKIRECLFHRLFRDIRREKALRLFEKTHRSHFIVREDKAVRSHEES